jgi:2-polyprenyl-3-methyl-5-hydroxy-6-metoxy-1,4-benzoquinol methylase
MNHPKSFYYNYQANDIVAPLDVMMNDFVLENNPISVLDYGCGVGKNLRYLVDKNPKLTVCGIDMSFLNIIHARAKNKIDMLIIGDEYHLCRLADFDIVITTSVLCHIQDIKDIVKELKRIANDSVIICETVDIMGEFYYAHDYESFGFEFVDLQMVSGNDALYKIYQWKKEN